MTEQCANTIAVAIQNDKTASYKEITTILNAIEGDFKQKHPNAAQPEPEIPDGMKEHPTQPPPAIKNVKTRKDLPEAILKRIVTRKELAALLHRNIQWADHYVKKHPGCLEKVYLPFGKYSAGYSFDSVCRLLNSSPEIKRMFKPPVALSPVPDNFPKNGRIYT